MITAVGILHRILLVEDSAADAWIVREALAEVGNAEGVVHVVRLAEALERIREGGPPFDAALIDLALPDARGIEIVRALRAAAPNLPLVLLTGNADDELALQAMGEGAQDYLTKDVATGSAILRAVRHAIERERLRRELAEVNARLRELDAAKSAFLAMVSHDLRTPIASMRGAIDNLLGGVLGEIPPEQRTSLDIIRRSSARLTRLVTQVLDLARIEAGALALERSPVDLCALLGEVLQEIEPLAAKRRIRLSLDASRRPLVLNCDGDRISEVATNLVSNAIDFARTSVRVSLSREEATVVLVVEDDGPGIPPSDLDRMFERFYTGNLKRPSGRSGGGLGLAIVKGLVEAHGGTVRPEILPGKGARMVVKIPARVLS